MAEALLVRKGGSSGNATASDLLSGKTATVSTGDITGTMSNNGTVNITPSTTNQTIAQGYHSGSGVVYGDADLISANIKSGANIFGVAGNSNVVDTSAGTAVAGDILSGKIAFVDGAQITGTIASKTAQTYTPSTSTQTIASGQYLSGTQTISGDANLVAGNIKSGVNIFGIAGTFNPQYTAKYNFTQPGTTATYNYDFGTSVIASIARFVGSNGSDSNFNCVVSGSNNNSTFTSLYNADLRGYGSQAGTYANLGSTPYRYYRVAVTALATATYCSHGFVLVPNGTMGV